MTKSFKIIKQDLKDTFPNYFGIYKRDEKDNESNNDCGPTIFKNTKYLKLSIHGVFFLCLLQLNNPLARFYYWDYRVASIFRNKLIENE